MDIFKIKEEMLKISLELSKKLPKKLQDDKAYINNMFFKGKKKNKKVINRYQ